MPIQPEPPHVPEQLTGASGERSNELARPLPSSDELAIEGLTDDEWKAFEAAPRIVDDNLSTHPGEPIAEDRCATAVVH